MRPLPLALSLSALAVLSGCTGASRSIVHRADVEALARVDETLRGREAVISLARPGEPARGRIEFVRPDSTAWTDDEAFWTVPTAGVYGIVAGNRWQAARRGALIGAGVAAGLALAVVAADSGDFDAPELGAIVFLVAAPYGIGYGAGIGAAGGNEVEVVFTGTSPAVAAGPPE
ncbi:MAG TPA: hypothetical protein VF576_09835 [Rubricoccaceae bacterium]